MPLSAFTNKPGAYARRELVTDYSYGYKQGGLPGPDSDYARIEESYKDYPFYSDGHAPTTYQRKVFKIQENTPEIKHVLRQDWSDEPPQEDASYVRHPWTWAAAGIDREWPYIDDILSNAMAKANVEALNGLGEDKQQLIVDLLESRKSFQMLLDAALDFRSILNAAKRGNWPLIYKRLGRGNGRGLPNTKNLADRYLEYRYGWSPLVSSIYGYQEALKRDWTTPQRLKSKGFCPVEYSRTDVGNDGAYQKKEVNGGVKTVYEASFTGSKFFLLDQLGCVNPASIAWEVVPFSFVIDWFVPVGDVLEAYTALVGLEDVRGYTSVWLDWTDERQGPQFSRYSWPSLVTVEQPFKLKRAQYSFNRYAHGPKRPEFYGEPSPFGGKKSSRGWAAAALIRQLLK